MRVQMSFLEYLSYHSRSDALSELHSLNILERRRVIQAIESIPVDEIPLEEWNDALSYLVGQSPEMSISAPRERLISCLKHPDISACAENNISERGTRK